MSFLLIHSSYFRESIFEDFQKPIGYFIKIFSAIHITEAGEKVTRSFMWAMGIFQ